MINRRQLADTGTADRKDENSSPLPSCQRHEDEFGEPEMCGPLCIAHTTPNEKTTRKPQAIGRLNIKHTKASGNWMKQNENAHLPQAIGQNKTKIPICLRQFDETKRKCPFASGNWTKQSKNTHLLQAIGQNKIKTPKSLRQLDETKRKHPFASGNCMPIKMKRIKIPAIDCKEIMRQATDG